eukprot:m.266157 g.266157  ORF g.266157 m.266157 type:complete len:279 (+) comp65657_c0_seq1:370-1206(+)
MSENRQLSATENTLLGVLSGGIEVSILQPILYLKNASQQKLPFTLNPSVLYRGLAMSCVNMAVLTGIQFPLTGVAQSLMKKGENRPLTDSEAIAAGAFGGVLSGFACAPMELVIIQQQRFGGSLFGTPIRIVRANSPFKLWRGLLTSCGREGLYAAGYMGMGPVISKKCETEHGMSSPVAIVVGSITAALIAGTLSHPLDTVKTVVQGDVLRSDVDYKPIYRNEFHAAQVVYAENGALGFFRGWHWRTARMAASILIIGECKKILSPTLFPDKYKDDF